MNELFKLFGSVDVDIKEALDNLAQLADKAKEAGETLTGGGGLSEQAKEVSSEVNAASEAIIRDVDGISEVMSESGDASKGAAKEVTGATDKMKDGLKDVEEGANETGEAFNGKGGLTSKLKESSEKIKEIAQDIQTVGTTMTAMITVPLAGLGVAGTAAAKQFDDAMLIVKNGLGATDEEAERLTETAQNIYNKGFEGSIQDITSGMVNIKQVMQDLVSDSELQEVTEQATVLAQTMGEDIGWIGRAASAAANEFKAPIDEIMDTMAWGVQNGLNYSNELADNVAEYSADFNKMGFSLGEYFSIMKRGVDSGAYTMDRVNDAVREFHNNIIIDTKNAEEAMKMMSGSTQATFRAFQDGHGTARDVLKAVTQDLAQMDGQLQEEAGMKVFRIMWEEMNRDLLIGLGDVQDEIGNIDGTMAQMADNAEETFSAKLNNILRETKEALKPIGENLIEIAHVALPPLIQMLEILSDMFVAMPEWMQMSVVGFGALLAAIGPFFLAIGSALSGLTSMVEIFGKLSGGTGLLAKGFTMVKAAILPLIKIAAPLLVKVALIVAAVVAVVAAIKGLIWIFQNFGEVIGDVLMGAWDLIVGFFKGLVQFIKERTFGGALVSAILDAAKDAENPLDFIMKLFENTIENILGMFGFEIEWPDLMGGLREAWQDVKDFFAGGIDWITGLFDFEWNWPSFGGGKPNKGPGVSWNAAGGVFTKPTIFNTANAGLQGVGEAGPEAIIPLNEATFSQIASDITGHMQPQTQQNTGMLEVLFSEFLKEQRKTREEISRMKVQMDGHDVGRLVSSPVDNVLGKRKKFEDSRFD